MVGVEWEQEASFPHAASLQREHASSPALARVGDGPFGFAQGRAACPCPGLRIDEWILRG